MKINIKIMTPQSLIYESGNVDSIVGEGSEGSFGILANHMPLISLLRSGSLRIKCKGIEHIFEHSEGLLRFKDNRAYVLCNNIKIREENLENE